MAMAFGSGPSDSELVADSRIVGEVRPRMRMEIVPCIAVGRNKWLAAARKPARVTETARRSPALTSPLRRACNPVAPTTGEGAGPAPNLDGAREHDTEAKEELNTRIMGWDGEDITPNDTLTLTVSELRINEAMHPASESAANESPPDITTARGKVLDPGANVFGACVDTLGLSRAACPTTFGGGQV